LLGHDAADGDRYDPAAEGLNLGFLVPQLGQLVRSDRAEVEAVEGQDHWPAGQQAR
jgi:hypothetical protein